MLQQQYSVEIYPRFPLFSRINLRLWDSMVACTVLGRNKNIDHFLSELAMHEIVMMPNFCIHVERFTQSLSCVKHLHEYAC